MTSWADELDEEEKQQPQRESNAWKTGKNPWGVGQTQKKEEQPKSSIVDDSDFPLPGKEKAPREQSSSNGRANDDRRVDERREERRDDYRPRNDRPPREDYRQREDRDDRRRDDRPPRDDYRQREDRDDRRRDYQPRERREFYGHDDREGREDRRSSEREDDRFGGPRRGGFGKGGFNRRDREPREQKPREPIPFPTQAPFTAFVGNLPFTINTDDLQQFFAAEGCKVAHIRIIATPDGKLKGYGYVEFEDLESLKTAVGMNDQPLMERPLKIDVAEGKPKQEDRPWKKRDSSPPRDSTSPSEPAKERPKIALQPPSEARKAAAPSEAYKSSKSNPFGEAKPRDENEILKKKEEERKQRETTTPKSETVKEDAPLSPKKPEDKPLEERKPREEPFRPAQRKDDRPPRRDDRPPRDDNRRDDRGPRRDDRGPRRDDNRGPRRDDNRGPRRDDNRGPRRDDNRRDDKPRSAQPNNTTSVPAAKRAPWAPKQEEPKAVQSANIFGVLGEEDE